VNGALEYQFWRLDVRSGAWSLVQNYGSSESYSWTPDGPEAGLWILQVWVRVVGSAQPYEAWAGSGYVLVEP
jgi:hypothetical protein